MSSTSLYGSPQETGVVSSANSTSLYSNTTDFTTGLVNSSVFSVSGGTGVTVNPITGNVVVSIGQAVATTSNVTFANITATGNLSNAYYTLANALGTVGQVLTTNGAGATAWTSVSGLGLVNSVTGSGAGISVSPTTGAVIVSNTGVTSAVAGTGIGVSGATGAVTFSNTGVTSIVAGTNITVSGATGAVTVNATDTNTTYNIDASTVTGGANLNLTGSDASTDTVKFASGTGITVSRTDANTITVTNSNPGGTGVTSITGTANQVIASASTGAVTLSTPQSIATTSSPTFASLTLTGDLDVRGSDITNSTGGINITTAAASNANILLDPDGTGRVQVNADIEATGNGNFNGAVIINNDQTVTNPAYQAYSGAILGSLTWNGSVWDASGGINSDGGDFGNVTVGIATDNTISTTTGDLVITSATSAVTVTGDATITGDLNVQGGDITNSTGELRITSGSANSNIVLTPSGTGDVLLTADTVQIGDLNTNAALTTNGTGDLVLNTNNGTNSGQITILDGASGNITFVPNGTGNVVNTFNNGGNLTNNRNYVFGAIRNATSAGAGDVWTFGPAGTGYRGISLDNSADTTKGVETVTRSYTGGAVAAPLTRPRYVLERARGTAASPTALQSGDQIGSIDGSGYTSTGWVTDLVTVIPATQLFSAAENWVSNTNLGSTYTLLLAPTATTIATGANLVSVIAANPQTFASRSDAFTWANGKTGATQTMALDVSGNLTVTGDVRINGNDIQNSAGTAVISMTGANTTTTVNTTLLSLTNPTTQTTYGGSTNVLINAGNPAAASFNDRVSQFRVQTASTVAGEASTITFNTANYNTGTKNFSVTNTGDTLGEFFFGGNYGTSTTFTTLGPSVRFKGVAAETFSATNSGGRFVITLDKIGGTTIYDAITIDSANANIGSDIITLESNTGTDFVVIDANTAKFNVPVTTEITTTTISEGTTYTPAATVDNNISVQINALAGGTTVIDLASLTGNNRGASYNILVFNNTGSGATLHVINSRISGSNLMAHTITTGSPRIIVNAYVVGNYATATHLNVA